MTLFLIQPFEAMARHNDYEGVNRSGLDRDIVETMPLPILFGLTYGQIRSDFGEPRGDGTRSHEGQDMLAQKGTPLVSPTEAIVIRTGEGDSAGKYVYTANPGGETFRYMHLDTIADLDSGDRLSPGDFIGTVGDTGNAPDGVYHLHFEIRDEDNEATDPYPRLTDTFTLEEKMETLPDIFAKIRNDADYAEFLVATFPDDFKRAVREGYDLPRVITTALKETGVVANTDKEQALAVLIATIPSVLTPDIKVGDQGAVVALLQLYVIFTGTGPARDRLAAAGATGYFGPTTAAAVAELQVATDEEPTGVFNTQTKAAWQK